MKRTLFVTCVVLVTAAACGEGDGSKPAEGAAPAPAAAGATNPNGSAAGCKVITHQTLETFLPVMADWTRGEPRGDTDTAESVSRTTVDYNKGPSTLSFEFMDSCMNGNMLRPFNDLVKAGDQTHTGGYTKIVTLAGVPAVEEWTQDSLQGTLHVILSGRFMVAVTGAGVPDVETIRKAMNAIDLQKMAALK